MLAQLIRLLPKTQQRDPNKLQEIRRLVELFLVMDFMRHVGRSYGFSLGQ